jgi:ABC-type glycerol-3-phosphate transport system substrate-binding protein
MAGGNGITINVAGTDVSIKPGGGKTFNPKTPITITIWDSQRGANQDALNKLADAFHATHSNITIKWDNNNNTFAYGDILKKLQSSATAGGLPNLATGYENWVPGFVDSKTILGFNKFISGDYGLTQEQLQDIQPAFLARGIFPQYGNETYLFPFGNSTPALYYNKDLLDKYGLQVPQTWDDLVKASQAIAKQSNGTTVGLVFSPKTVSEFVAGMFSQGCKIYDYATKTWFFTDPNCVKQLQLYYDGVKNGYFKASDPTQQNGDEISFEKQEAAFWISSTSSRSYIDSDTAKGTNGTKVFNWNAQVIPHAATITKPIDTLYGGGVLAFKGKSDDEDLATWEVAKFLASSSFTAAWASQSGYAPATKSALDDATYKAFVAKNPHNGIPVQIVQYATVSEPKIGQWQSVRDEFDNDVFALFQDQSGALTVDSTMKKIQDAATALVK